MPILSPGEWFSLVGLMITLIGVASRLMLIEVDKRIEREVYKRVSVAKYSEDLTRNDPWRRPTNPHRRKPPGKTDPEE